MANPFGHRCDLRGGGEHAPYLFENADELSANYVVSVNPDAVAVTPSVPMSRDPNVINSTVPISRTMDVIGLIAHTDVDRNRIRDAAYAK